MHVEDELSRAAGIHPAVGLGAGAGALLAVAAASAVLFRREQLRRAGHRGRQASRRVPPTRLPLTSYTRHGHQGDPLNVQIVATAAQLGAAFADAGWYRADELDTITSARICADSVLARKYSTAPVSNLYLYGRREDLAFERPGQSVRERDHIRLWQTGRLATDGRPIWLGGATRDVRVELAKTNHLPTHQIAPDTDSERDMVVSELQATDFVAQAGWRPGFGAMTHSVNGGGDPWYTDGRVAVLTLADVWVPAAVAHAHGVAGAGLARAALRLSRRLLPQITHLPRHGHAARDVGSAVSSM